MNQVTIHLKNVLSKVELGKKLAGEDFFHELIHSAWIDPIQKLDKVNLIKATWKDIE